MDDEGSGVAWNEDESRGTKEGCCKYQWRMCTGSGRVALVHASVAFSVIKSEWKEDQPGNHCIV